MVGTAGTVLALLLACQKPLQAAETCPIFNEVTAQMEPVPTLTAWALDGAPTGVISADDASSFVNVREDAGTAFVITATAQSTEAITMTAHALSTDCENWFRVEFEDDRTGWVHGQYVDSDRGFSLF